MSDLRAEPDARDDRTLVVVTDPLGRVILRIRAPEAGDGPPRECERVDAEEVDDA